MQEFVQRLYDNDQIYKGTYTGPYCVHCEEFKVPGELIQPGNLCPVHHRPVEMLSEDNYFFRLSAYQDRLLEAYRDGTLKVEPESARNEVLRFVESGLSDISMSRSTFDWGITVPWDSSHVIYVWIDALLNYWTAVEGNEEYWPADVHLVGKDILRFHAVIWPAMLMAAGLPLPKQVFANGWLLVGGEKMSKTKVNGISPQQITDHFGSDAFRYYFLREIAYGQDGSFSWESMSARYQSELADQLGNLASRLTSMVERYREGALPPGKLDAGLAEGLAAAAAAADAAMEPARFPGCAGRDHELRAHGQRLRHRARAVEARQGPGEHRRARRRALLDRRRPPGDCCPAELVPAEGLSPALGEPRGAGRAGRRQDRRRHDRSPAGRRGGPQGTDPLPAARRVTRDEIPPPPQPLTVPAVDSHCHLDLLTIPVEEALAAARLAGIPRVVTVGIDVASSRWCAQTAAAHDGVVAAVAMHPNEAPESADLDADIEAIAELAKLPQVRAIGETGLDYYRTEEAGRPKQEESFRRHIALAKTAGKALVIHDRDAHADVLRVLDDEGAPERVVLHCFSGGPEFARDVRRARVRALLRRQRHLQQCRPAS